MTESIRIYQALKQDIITCELSPGASLSEAEFSTRYSAGRTPVREACRRLQEEGLLQIVPFRGYFIAPLTISEYRDLHEVQLVVDPAAAALAAERASAAQIQTITHWARYQYHPSQKTSYCTFLEWNRNLHIAIAEASGNKIFVEVVSKLQTQLMRYFYLVISMDSYGQQLVQEHLDIANAIKRRDADLARRRAAEHVLKTIQRSSKLDVSAIHPQQPSMGSTANIPMPHRARAGRGLV